MERNKLRKNKIWDIQIAEVSSFKDLGTIVEGKNERCIKIYQSIQARYRANFSYKALLKTKKICHRTKIKIYKSAIRPVVTYTAEIMFLTNKEDKTL